MSVVNWKIRLNGPGLTDFVIDAGLPTPHDGGYLSFDFEDADPDSEYMAEVGADDGWNITWSDPFPYTTPTTSFIWITSVIDGWDLDTGDSSWSANRDTFEGVAFIFVPLLHAVGDWIDVAFVGNPGRLFLHDSSVGPPTIETGNTIGFYGTSQVDYNGGFGGFYTAFGDNDIVRVKKIIGNKVSYSVNGGSEVELPYTMIGDLIVHAERVTVIGQSVVSPATNVDF